MLDPAFRAEHARLWADEHLGFISARLGMWHADGVPTDRPLPQFVAECTPPFAEAYEPFRKALSRPTPTAFAEALQTAGCGNILVLLGQRRTPASLTDARGIPPTLRELINSASALQHPGEELIVAARALAKHSHRSPDQVWGKPTGPAAEQNAYAIMLLRDLFINRTWWNVFGHFQHDTVYEARVPSGHGARWGAAGTTFIGFLEPFDESKCPSLAPEGRS